MIDKDEYPQTAELEHRCVNILGHLWNAPREQAVGCSTTGSSEACMLGGMALLWRWRARRRAAGPGHRPAEPRHGHQRPGLLGEVLPLLGRGAEVRPAGPRPVPPGRPRGRRAVRREHHRRRRDHGLDDGRLLRAGGGARRGARRPGGRAGGPRRADPRGRRRPAGSSRRSCSRRSSGTSGCRGSPRSTPPGTSTAWSTRAWAGSSGATRSTCPRT